jgi:hypothetical protein
MSSRNDLQLPTLVLTYFPDASGKSLTINKEKKMSHFSVYALVSGSTIDIRRRVRYLMEPYHNDFEVEEYQAAGNGACSGDGHEPDCTKCDGTYLTTCNPMSKFDGYSIWDSGHVLRNASKNPSDWEDEETFDDDIPDDDGAAIAPIESLDLDRLKLPFAIVTPSGEWHEMEGDWWDMATESTDWKAWEKTVRDLFSKYPTAILVVLNCHR